jgi:hypothetical protein
MEFSRTSFIDGCVFPDGELEPLATTIDALQGAGFEVRDVESLREHYALTPRAWVANLENGWDGAVHHASGARARIWRLYMAGSPLPSKQTGSVSIKYSPSSPEHAVKADYLEPAINSWRRRTDQSMPAHWVRAPLLVRGGAVWAVGGEHEWCVHCDDGSRRRSHPHTSQGGRIRGVARVVRAAGAKAKARR